jgi:hypothetical protein
MDKDEMLKLLNKVSKPACLLGWRYRRLKADKLIEEHKNKITKDNHKGG